MNALQAILRQLEDHPERILRGAATVFVGILTVLTAAGAEIHVDGPGYFRLLHEGRAVYAKSVSILQSEGELKSASGASFLPAMRVSASDFRVDEEGWIIVGASKRARIVLARLPSEPEPMGGFFVSRERAELGYAGLAGFGKIATRHFTPPTATVSKPKSNESPYKTAKRLSIVVPATADVPNKTFTLGEIAQISGSGDGRLKALDLGNSPVHGVPMTYSRERIRSRIASMGVDLKEVEFSMGPSVQIRREGQVVSPNQILETARLAVQAKTALKGELDSQDRLADLHVPLGALELQAESVSLSGGTATVTVGIRVDGKRFLGRTVRLTGPAIEPAILAGSSLTVRFVSNGLIVEMPGRARSAGAVGQMIEVLVSTEGSPQTSHQAVVVARGVAEVKL